MSDRARIERFRHRLMRAQDVKVSYFLAEAEVITALLAIVETLAECDPIHVNHRKEARCGLCAMPSSSHDPWCPYRQARELLATEDK
jgi:hypothetical protein